MSRRFYGRGLPGVDLALLRGKLIVIEGADGSGRTTHTAMLRDWMERSGYATEEVGLKRSNLVAAELDRAQQGNTLGPITQTLFYATDFADQLENKIIPALRSGFIVLADRYIYTMMARAMVRKLDQDWVRKMYSIALVPDAVFYLDVPPKVLAGRIFRKGRLLDYWESGMDVRRTGDMYSNFIKYQDQVRSEFRRMRNQYGFDVVNGNRSPRVVHRELQGKIQNLLGI
ncbi:MAG TPA: dTMP kinase [candidate division Zixibacteria bacterium]|nr:dTMP kinase [candidate division Zixibacteria bacterium]